MFASPNPFGQSLSSPFGSSQSVFGQQNNSNNNPFAPKPIGSRTPLGSQTANSSTSAGVFGATQMLSPFSSNTTSSASSSPAFNSSMPAFGVSYTPSFGNSWSSYGGLSCSGQKPAIGGFRSTPTQTSPFDSSIQPPQPAFGSNNQQSQQAFGSSLFDSSAPFCASSQPAFGSTSTPAFGATTIPTFAGSSGTLSASSTPAFSFGSPTQGFGQSSSALGTSSPFGSTNSAFGGQIYAFGSHTPTQTFENTGIGQSEFGRQRSGSRVASYSATTQPDGGSGRLGEFKSISTMSIYKDKSHEELRWEDYQLGDKGGPLASAPQSTGMAGFKSYTTQKNAFSQLVFAQSSVNPFSSTTPNSNNPFAPKPSTFSSGFGTSAPAFSSLAFDSSSMSAFGTSSSLASSASSIPAFGGQSSVFGPQIHTQAFVGRSGFVGQMGGSRVTSYSATTEIECGSGQPRKLESISAMPSYKDKSHEELRWEDYLLGTKAFGQSSSRPFGSSQSVFGQQNNSSNNPSASKPFGSPIPLGLQTGNSSTSAGVLGATQTLSPFSFNTTSSASSSPAFNSSMPASGASSTPAYVSGQKPTFGGFSSTPTQRSPFGSATQPSQPAFGSNTQQSQPAFGSSIFGSSTPFGASSQPAFGSTGTPAFGAPSTPAFGATSTPAFGTTSTPAFGATSTPAFGSTTTPAFGRTGSVFGMSNTSVFGGGGAFVASSSPVFGSSSSTPAFGASSSPAFGASSTPAFSFGSSIQAFGQSSSAFGTSSPFGSTTSAFGGQSSAFGSHTPTQTFENTGIRQLEFGRQRGGSRVASYSVTTEMDVVSGQLGKLESISAMPVYKDKSHEELRWEDYQLGDKGEPIASSPRSTGMAGFNSSTTKTNAFSPSPLFGQSSPNPFSTKACGLSSSAFGTFYPFGEDIQFGDKDIRSGQTEKLESISAIILYNDKSHEELRWEDYHLGSSAPTNAQSGSEFGQNTFPFGQTAGFRPSDFFGSHSSRLVGSIFSSMASLSSNAPSLATSMASLTSNAPSLAILTGTVVVTVVVTRWISLRSGRA